ncbi:MAG: polyphosphate polymerase domain-containing protein [Prevotella sp.]|nr:polyphosphate polymerase domain-containing protein [Prevotella sp.]
MNEILAQYAPISLEEMSGIKLMNRIDTKFVTTMPVLMRLLAMAREKYWAQEIAGERNMRYDTTYYDTKGFDMFYVHQSGHTGRQKLRFRTYVSSNLQFMEVKTKNNHGRTKKKRMKVTDMDLDEQEKIEFLQQHLRYDKADLIPTIRNNFDRITLVNKAKTERLTIDSNLQFFNLVSGVNRHMGELVIVELKRDGLCYSPVLEMLRQLRVFPHGFSKYCMGSALTNDQLQINRFKPKLIDVSKILYHDSSSLF